MSMCFKEQLKVSPKDLSEIIVSANQDIRLIINHLSMLSIGNTRLANSSKHIKLVSTIVYPTVLQAEQRFAACVSLVDILVVVGVI